MKPEECGIAVVDGKKRYITGARAIERGKRAGQVEVRLVSGAKKVLMPGQIIREAGYGGLGD